MSSGKSFGVDFIHNKAQSKPTHGFRFSLTDGIALLTFGAIAAGLYRLDSALWWMLVIAAGHFFLFCNIFRVNRRRELTWAACFLLNVGFWLATGQFDWSNVLLCQLPVTVGIVVREIKGPRYHGVFAARLNPALRNYLEGGIP
jgi:hypothetical protein